MQKEKAKLLEKFGQLKEEYERLLVRIKEESIRYQENMEAMNRALAERDEDLAKKDAMIKSLT